MYRLCAAEDVLKPGNTCTPLTTTLEKHCVCNAAVTSEVVDAAGHQIASSSNHINVGPAEENILFARGSDDGGNSSADVIEEDCAVLACKCTSRLISGQSPNGIHGGNMS